MSEIFTEIYWSHLETYRVADNVNLKRTILHYIKFDKCPKMTTIYKKWNQSKNKTKEVHICNMCKRILESFIEMYSAI